MCLLLKTIDQVDERILVVFAVIVTFILIDVSNVVLFMLFIRCDCLVLLVVDYLHDVSSTGMRTL